MVRGGLGDSVTSRKAALRSEMKKKLRELTSDQAKLESQSIAKTLLDWPAFKSAGSVGLYVSCPKLKEVQTELLLEACVRQRKRCYVPKVEGDGNMRMLEIHDPATDLAPAPPYGIPEPVDLEHRGKPRAEAIDEGLDLLLVPGVAFDAEGRRMGRGAGYYDKYIARFLSTEARGEAGGRNPLLAALCFDCQVVHEVPCEDHDVRMDAVVTPKIILGKRGG